MSKIDLELEYKNFDWNSYVSYYEDLKKDNVNTKEKAWRHWINYGRREERLYFDLTEKINTSNEEVQKVDNSVVVPINEDFDWVKYTNYYTDLKDDNIDTIEKAWNHWIKYGEKEGRTYFNVHDEVESNTTEYINFDWEFYLQFYNDLQHQETKQCAWEHWNKHGKNENRIYFDLNNSSSYKEFEWNTYVNNYEDLKYITTKEQALKHWLSYGVSESRTFLQKNTSKTLKYNFEDLFLINLSCNYLCIKNNIKFEYKCSELFQKFGIDFFVGKNTYKTDFVLTNENFFELINNGSEIIDKNIILSNDIDCVTTEYCLFLKKIFYENNENQNKITQKNIFKNRYLSNKDLYIYIYINNSYDEIYIKQLFEYYNETIKKVKCDKIYISSNNIQHELCQKIISIHSVIIDNKEMCEKIMFANTCKYLILSNDITSLLFGFFNFFSKHNYYPIVNSKYSDIFQSFGWKGINLSKINIKPKLIPPPIKKKNQASSPTDEWYDSPFIIPKPLKPKPVSETKPLIKIKQEGTNHEPIHIKFDKFE